jgi:CAAX protease family protein
MYPEQGHVTFSSLMTRPELIVEFLVLFLALPLAYRFSPVRIPALPLLWVVSGYALWQLIRDPHFSRGRLWNAARLPGSLSAILITFAVVALLLWLGVHRFAPQLEWSFVRRHPAFWVLVMVAYPALSVYPQGLLYRAFFFERYAPLFPGRWTMIVASAAAFAFLHIVFRNPLAVALTFGGGILFAFRYAETSSLATSAFEHALYGCWLFTIGLGKYFYHERAFGTVSTLMRR